MSEEPARQPFTSGLSVKEFALLRRLGPEPLAQVMGASVVRPGWQYLPALDPGRVYSYGGSIGWRGSLGPQAPVGGWRSPYTEPSPAQVRSYKWHTEVVCELDELTRAWTLARRQARDRLVEEALQVGGHAVVGVRLERSDHDLGRGIIECLITGTAIRVPGSESSAWPVLSDLSVQDYWRLLMAGHEPCGLLAATSVVFASPPRVTRFQRTRTIATNQELEELSQAFALARRQVRDTLHGLLQDSRGTDAVGVSMEHSVHREKLALASTLQNRRGWHLGRLGIPYFVSGRDDVERHGWVITMHGAGTAVRRAAGGPREPPPVKSSIRIGGR